MILWVFIEFFEVKIVITDIYRHFTDILSIFFQKFQYKRAYSTVTIFRWKNWYFPNFRLKISDFIDLSSIFLLINFSSVFSSRCRLKTDFSTIYRPKKMIFYSLVDICVQNNT